MRTFIAIHAYNLSQAEEKRNENKTASSQDNRCISLYFIAPSECQEALGMENEAILDGQISASTEYDAHYAAKYGRLNSDESQGAWTAKIKDVNQWLQVELGEHFTTVTRVATQGSYKYEAEWVSMYKLQYSDDGLNFQYYRELGLTEDKVKLTPPRCLLSLFRPGGEGGFCPRPPWTLITFLILKQTLPNLMTCSKNYLVTI